MESEDEINEGVDIITELIRDYRHWRMELKSKLGNEYEAQYPNYENVLVNVANFKKEAEKRLNIVKHQSNKNKEMKVKIERNELSTDEKEVLDLKIGTYRRCKFGF